MQSVKSFMEFTDSSPAKLTYLNKLESGIKQYRAVGFKHLIFVKIEEI